MLWTVFVILLVLWLHWCSQFLYSGWLHSPSADTGGRSCADSPDSRAQSGCLNRCMP